MLRNCIEPFLKRSSDNPGLLAFTGKSSSITYREFELQIRETATALKARGIRKGDRVLVLVPMSVELYRNVLALFYIGAVAVFVDQWVSLRRFRLCCKLADCNGIILKGKFRLLSWLLPETRKIKHKIPVKCSGTNATQATPANVLSDDAALITFTTGSTGLPKAAERSHGFLLRQLNAVSQELQATAGETDLSNLPIVLLCNLANGTSSFLDDFKLEKKSFAHIDSLVNEIKKSGVNRISGSPYFVTGLADSVLRTGQKLPALKRILTGGGPVFPNDAIKISNAFPDVLFNVIYGSTEAEPISVVSGRELSEQKIDTVADGLLAGYPVNSIKLKIIQSDLLNKTPDAFTLDLLACKTGEKGEIIVSGDHVLDRYYKNEDAFNANKIRTPEALWHRTGDCGFLDERGRLFLCGRLKDMFVSGDQVASPFIAEYLLKQIQGVTAGAVITVKEQRVVFLESDEKSGKYDQAVSTVVPEAIRIVVVGSIPRDPRHHTKIDYEKLRKMI